MSAGGGALVDVGGYGVDVSASVYCIPPGTMEVSARTGTMQKYSYFGTEDGPYDNGQWVNYRVWARDVNAASWIEVYGWSGWRWIVPLILRPDADLKIGGIPVDLGTNLVSGTAGQTYEVLIEIGWWTDKINLAAITPEYHKWIPRIGYIGGQYYDASSCAF
jgi:hypothetical protein